MIPFLDLKAQYHGIRDEIEPAIRAVLESGEFVLGAEVAAFESEFAAYCRARHGIAVNTGTSALHLALLAAGVGPGDEVITVPFTFVATVAAIGYTGARPVFVDVDPVTLTMDPALIEPAIGPHTRAIVPVHLYGRPADMDPILEIARRKGLVVIEDAAQAHGAEYKGRRVGCLGDFGCFSFYPGKNLGAYGEGGMVVTASDAHDRRLRMLRDWGAERKYEHLLRGYNYRMDGIQGAILRVKLRHLEAWNEARRMLAAQYDESLRDVEVIRPRPVGPDRRHVYHLYAIRVARRAAIRQSLQERGICTGIHYPNPVHLLPAWADLGHRRGDFPHSEAAADQVLSLPLYPELRPAQCAAVVEALRQVVGNRGDAESPLEEAAAIDAAK